MWQENIRGQYTCSMFSVLFPYHCRLRADLFGAATLVTKDMFEAVNGLSNMYYGWGAEDDDFRNR